MNVSARKPQNHEWFCNLFYSTVDLSCSNVIDMSFWPFFLAFSSNFTLNRISDGLGKLQWNLLITLYISCIDRKLRFSLSFLTSNQKSHIWSEILKFPFHSLVKELVLSLNDLFLHFASNLSLKDFICWCIFESDWFLSYWRRFQLFDFLQLSRSFFLQMVLNVFYNNKSCTVL